MNTTSYDVDASSDESARILMLSQKKEARTKRPNELCCREWK